MSEENINELEETDKKSKKPKVIGIIVVLLSIGFIVAYSISGTFKGMTNRVFSGIPFIGDIIKSIPTDEEIDQRETKIARYYIENLDPKSAADKLYIVKNEDLSLYNNLIRRMNGISAKKTDRILDEIRNTEIRQDTLADLYQEVDDERTQRIQEYASELESMDIRSAINKVMDGTSYREGDMERIFIYMSDNRAVDILHYVDGGTRSDMLYKLADIDMRRRNDLEKLLDQKRVSEIEKDNQAGTLASIHEVGNRNRSSEVLGSDEEIDINVIARTFMMMPEKAAAEILFHMEDREFVDRVYAEIKSEESVRGKDQSSLVLINQIKAYLGDYDGKLSKLVSIYERMDTELAGESILKLLENEDTLTVMEIREQDGYSISDYSVAVDIMKEMRDRNLKDVLESMDAEDVARISRILAEE